MNLFLVSSILCLACSLLISLATSLTHASSLGHVTVMSASGEELQSAAGEESETEGGASGVFTEAPQIRGRGGRKKHGGRKRNKLQIVRQRISTPAQNLTHSPAHNPTHSSTHNRGHNHNHSAHPDPCSTSHREYCIHGYCTYLQDLKEPVCVCMRGYDGVRCGIQLLQTGSGGRDQNSTDTLQISLITISIVLSIISCSALLIIICVHYRAQQSVSAAFLGATEETKKLQSKKIGV
ncbi:proheparin-binding EGF-like growth factor [Trichomycterus rosablanca]|uniref:proheparin-binding EGF-like growth factor n=1 Tax=Trichomycterus rosablanca TaxID=2290929 RepID=UPI002F35C076